MPTADGKRPGVVEYEALSHIEVGIAAFGSKIEGVARKFIITGSWGQRVRGVVDGMCPRVRRLEHEIVRHPLRNVRLQRVIDGRRGVIENLRVQESIVVDRIEGQTARLSTKPKIVKL